MRIRSGVFLLVGVMASGADKASSSSYPMKDAAFAAPIGNSETNVGKDTNEEIPQLPASDPNADIPVLKMGETLRFEEMGPIIINVDGSTRRIDNWDQMTDQEREVAWRRISKRNAERRKKLLEQQQQEEDS